MARIVLTPEDQQVALKALHPDWVIHEGALQRRIVFSSFSVAWAFMTRIALIAEKMDHHPRWTNDYNVVELTLITTDRGGLTTWDFDLALSIDHVASQAT